MKIVAPDDATQNYSDGILKLTFTQMSEETYKILNYRYNGIRTLTTSHTLEVLLKLIKIY